MLSDKTKEMERVREKEIKRVRERVRRQQNGRRKRLYIGIINLISILNLNLSKKCLYG